MEPWREELYHSELYHHGILGMKWYVRNGPPYPLDYRAHSLNEIREGWQRSLQGTWNSQLYGRRTARGQRSIYTKMKAGQRYRFRGPYHIDPAARRRERRRLKKLNQQYTRQHIRWGDTYNDPTVSKYRLQREAKAKKAFTTGLLLIGGLSILEGRRYFKNKVNQDAKDMIIKAGQNLSNVSANPKKVLNGSPFYASQTKLDQVKYGGFLGSQMRLGLLGDEPIKNIYKHRITAQQNIKVASTEHTRGVVHSLIRDDDYRNTLIKHLKDEHLKLFTPRSKRAVKTAIKELENDVPLSKEGYAGFNIALVNDKSPHHKEITSKFYQAMKEKGYDAIHDVNDSRYSGYNAKRPLIVFAEPDKVKITKTTKFKDIETYGQGVASIASMSAQEANRLVGLKGVAALAGLGITTSAVKKYKRMSDDDKDKVKKTAIGIAAGAGALAGITGGIAGVKYLRSLGKSYSDEVIKAGTTIQTLSMRKDRITNGKQFYANWNPKDIVTYEGNFTKKLAAKYKVSGQAMEDIRIANKPAAKRVFGKMMREDASFRNDVNSLIDALKRTEDNKNYRFRGKYDQFNAMVIPVNGSNRKASAVVDKYYDNLKKLGYSGIEDARDRRYQWGIRSKSASIIFDNSKIGNIKAKDLTKENIKSLRKQGEKRIALLTWKEDFEAGVKVGAAIAGGAVGGKIIGNAVSKKDREAVISYLKRHPYSKLTYNEILELQNGRLTKADKYLRKKEREQDAVLKYRREHPYSKLSDAEIIDLVMKRSK